PREQIRVKPIATGMIGNMTNGVERFGGGTPEFRRYEVLHLAGGEETPAGEIGPCGGRRPSQRVPHLVPPRLLREGTYAPTKEPRAARHRPCPAHRLQQPRHAVEGVGTATEEL